MSEYFISSRGAVNYYWYFTGQRTVQKLVLKTPGKLLSCGFKSHGKSSRRVFGSGAMTDGIRKNVYLLLAQ